MHTTARPNFFGTKLAVLVALFALSGVAMAHDDHTESQKSQPSASGTAKHKQKHDHKHPLPTTQEIRATLPSIPSAPHPSVSQAVDASLPQK
jgi:hypothetical protein